MTPRLSAALVVLVFASAVPARAELVFFASGRSLSVQSHRMDGDSLLLVLRDGGEITCDPALVARIGPDEVPYPEQKTLPADPIGGGGTPALVPLGELIDRVAGEQGVPAKLVRAVIQVESGYQERARSRKGAMGLMQLMPMTAQQYAVVDPYDPLTNLQAGIKHLKSLLERFPVPSALAAYNAGEVAVQRFRGIPPYPETQDYVARILRIVAR